MTDHILFTTSWDDGHPLDVRVAEILEEFGFVGTFYASTGPHGRRLISDRDLEKIGRNHELGIHGRTHTLFPSLSRGALAREIDWAARELCGFGSVARVVAPPKGKIDRATTRFLGTLGYSVRTAPIIGASRVEGGRLEPTFQLYPHAWRTIARNSVYRRRIPPRPLLLANARGGSFRERSRRMLQAAIRRGRYAHVWGHAGELEEFGLWDVLRDLLHTAADEGCIPVSNGAAFDQLTREARNTA